ncbi:MAG TPA: hypothetical protein ENJ82_10670 [Bacteroidetes bacterium]|nr:hypothetical protein [Bacteroidota bacterium]
MKTNKERQKKILVATEFGEGIEHTLRVAIKFAVMHDAEVVLLHVNELPMPMAEFFSNEDLVKKRKELAVKRLNEIVDSHKDLGVKISWMIAEGKPYKNILIAAEELMVEMIVMGIMGKHGKEYAMLGSNVHKVIRKATCPVITVTEKVTNTDFGRIMLAVDPEFGIRELRSFLQQYHEKFNPVVELVCVAVKDNEEECETYLAHQKNSLVKQGIESVVTTVLRGFSVSNSLLDHIAVSDVDMIWMETHGRKGLANFFLGSITEDVLVNSPIPVLSLHPEREAPTHGKTYYHENLPI